jgi:hypothetical protein
VLCVATDVLVQAQSVGGESTVSGTGVEVIKRPPELLRMQIEISAKAKTLGVALKKLEAHRDAALGQLAKMSSEKEQTRAGEMQISASASAQQRQMEMIVRQQMLQAGKVDKNATEKAVSVSCTLTAEWKLNGKTSVELLLEAQAIKDKVQAADLAGMDSEEPTAEEAELAEALQQQMPNFDDESQPKPGEPLFIFVSKVSPQDRAKATATAFAKARRQAEELSTAAGAELGALRGLSRQASVNDADFEIYSPYGGMRNASLVQIYSARAERGEEEGSEAIGTQPSEVALPIHVTAAFELKPPK